MQAFKVTNASLWLVLEDMQLCSRADFESVHVLMLQPEDRRYGWRSSVKELILKG